MVNNSNDSEKLVYLFVSEYTPAGTQRWNNVDSTLLQRLDVESTLFQRCVPAGILLHLQIIQA